MTRILQLTCLSFLASVLSFAANMSGWLVDSKCYTSMEFNRSEPPSYTNSDGNLPIRYCSPAKKSKAFAIVRQDDGLAFKFDPAGNEKAMDLGVNASSKFVYFVNVTGETHKNTFYVQHVSISNRFSRSGKVAPGL